MNALRSTTDSHFNSSNVASIRNGLQLGIPELSFRPLRLPAAQARLEHAVAADTGHCVLICAPAGTGKTVLAADWVRGHRSRHPETRVGWLSFTGRHGESAELWSAIGWALGVPGEAMAGVEPAAPLAEAATLIDQLTERQAPTVLVLDDAHLLVDPLALAGLAYFVENAPPTLTTIVAGRFDPPLRWHTLEMSGRLTRLGARELTLDTTRIAGLFDQHDCHLSEVEIADIEELTCGWAALVRIAAIYLAANAQDRTTALAALAHAPHSISDFLVGELLDALPDDALQFLLATAVPEEFTVALATELAGDHAAGILDGLLRNNLPISCVARGGRLWHSYHPMLRAYLLAEAARTMPERVQRIHRGCAKWFLDAHLPAAALAHVMAEPGHPQLARFIREHGPHMVFCGDGAAFFGRIEEGGGELADDQFVQLLRIAEAVNRSDIAACTAYLEKLRAEPYSASALVPAAWLTALREAVIANVAAITGAEPAAPPLTTPTPTGHADLDCYIILQLANAHVLQGDIEHGEPGLWQALALAQRAGMGHLVVLAAARLALCGGIGGHITVMRKRAEHAIDLAGHHGLRGHPAIAYARVMIAYARHLQGEPPDSRATPLPGAVTAGSSPAPIADRQAAVVTQLIEFDSATDRYGTAAALRIQLLELLDDGADPANTGNLLLHAVLALLRIQSRDGARVLVERGIATLGRTPEVALADAAFKLYLHSPALALDQIEPLLSRPDELNPLSAVTAWLLYASASDQLDRSVKTYEALSQALARAADDRIVRPFFDVEGIVALLDASVGRFGHHDRLVEQIRARPVDRAATARQRLTDMEMSVLRQLPSGMTTLNIAETMGVSINTVKTHLRGIYHKLGTGSRADAISRAREQGLI